MADWDFGRRRWAGAALGVILLTGGTAGAAWADPAGLMPLPREVREIGASRVDEGLRLQAPFAVRFDGYHDARLQAATARFQGDVNRLAGLSEVSAGTAGPTLVIATRPDAKANRLGAAESYHLTVDAQGVRLTADGPDGVLRGLATLRQLVERRGEGAVLPYIEIDDAPRFAWRGLMIDTARHFMTLETLKRQIDAMERVKLNVLHLHFSDNEGFRIESLRYPRLTTIASHGQYYTQDQVRDLVAYAAARGVRVVPEIDLPAHTGAIMTAYPELAAGAFDPNNRISMFGAAMDPTKPETYVFIRGLLEEMSGLFPDAYFHVGGDEVSAAAWNNNPAIRAYMAEHGYADAIALQDHFFVEVNKIVKSLGRTSMGWEEVAHQPIDDDVVVQAWRSSQATAHATGQGNRVVVSAGYYLDLLWSGADHYGRDPLDLDATPPDSPEKVLGPKPEGPLNAAQAALVIGGEAPLWAETVTDEMLDGRLWPRAALMAERFWSRPEVRDPVDAARRGVVVQEALRTQGLMDDQHRRAMAARLASQDADAVVTLASAVTPVRNMGRLTDVFAAFRSGRPLQIPSLTALVDVSAPDSVELYRLTHWASALAAGDRTAAAPLAAALAAYRDNHPRFVAAAQGVPALEAAVPASEETARLATAGIAAIDAIVSGKPASAEWRAETAALLAKQAEAEAASSNVYKIMGGVPQPPALVLMGLAPVVKILFEAAPQ
ncbi:MAG: beta-N-acetylhexosaminidase [Proteobacteria bacterium]|nr:beta-N-acetylhexosaminidase [Pseudomonadota bacterium]